VGFPVNIHANEAIHEIQFGHIRRPNHRSRPYDADRFEVCNHKWSALAEEGRGVAVLNDSKYGLNVLGNTINLTLLKSALAPDPVADKGMQSFTYSVFVWTGSLADSRVVEEAYDINVPLLILPGHPEARSLYSLDRPNIVLETVKPAEDGSGKIINRLYECKRTTTRTLLSTTLPVCCAAVTDMIENVVNEIDCHQGQIMLQFRPFEIKTILLRLA
jgi:alpha-mannosidase